MKNISIRNYRSIKPADRRANFIGHIRKEDDTIDLYEHGDEELWKEVLEEISNKKTTLEEEVERELEEIEKNKDSDGGQESLLSEPLFTEGGFLETSELCELLKNDPKHILNLEELSKVVRHILLES